MSKVLVTKLQIKNSLETRQKSIKTNSVHCFHSCAVLCLLCCLSSPERTREPTVHFLYISLSVIMASAFFVGPRSTSIFCHPQRVEDIFDSVFLQLVFSLSLSTTTIPCLHFRSRPDLILAILYE